jgi:hypothetical protein
MKNVNAEKVSLEDVMRTAFGERVRPTDGGFKVNIKNLINDGMKRLLAFDQTHNIQVNRSGYGLVIIVTEK